MEFLKAAGGAWNLYTRSRECLVYFHMSDKEVTDEACLGQLTLDQLRS